MPIGLSQTSSSLLLLSLAIASTSFSRLAGASAAPPPVPHHYHSTRGPSSSNPLNIDWSPAPSPEDGPPGAAHALRDPAYLPAQIAGIVGSYAFSLVVVALLLLVLSKKRREHLRAAEELEQVWGDRNDSNLCLDYGYDEQPAAAAPAATNAVYLENPPSYRDGVYETRSVSHIQQPTSPGHGHIRNFSLPSPTSLKFEVPRFAEAPSRFEEQQSQEAPSPSSYFLPSPTSTTRGPLGQDLEVPQDVVQHDRAMAQAELEQMYKYVMEQEEAKEAGVEFRAPMVPAQPRDSTMTHSSSSLPFSRKEKKEKSKPASLNLAKATDKKESRTSSILSALKSPRKKKQLQGMSISSPIMTPMSGTFPSQAYAGEEMSAISPRQYAPAIPPPVPRNHSQAGLSFAARRNTGHIAPLMTPPDLSPESTQSIDERIGAIATVKSRSQDRRRRDDGGGGDDVSDMEDDEEAEGNDRVGDLQHSRHISVATTTADADPVSAVSETSQSGLLRNANGPGARTSGLPTSPKPGVNRFPSLPSSPKPGATFASSSFVRANAPSAVRTGGTLPLRAYESAMLSPTTQQAARTVKETVFQRAVPMTPGGMHTAPLRTPLTGNPVPYSPYQPFSPVIPITPSLVSKADRKAMRRLEPKTPTLQMVKNDDELW